MNTLNKKVYRANSAPMFFLYTILILFIVCGIICICFMIVAIVIQEFSIGKGVLGLCCGVTMSALGITEMIKKYKIKIVLYRDHLYASAWGRSKKLKVQYETIVNYSEIKNIYLTKTSNNSLERKTPTVYVPMLYIVFECVDGMKKFVNVYSFSKKRIFNILDEVILRARATENMMDFPSSEQIFKNQVEAWKN